MDLLKNTNYFPINFKIKNIEITYDSNKRFVYSVFVVYLLNFSFHSSNKVQLNEIYVYIDINNFKWIYFCSFFKRCAFWK